MVSKIIEHQVLAIETSHREGSLALTRGGELYSHPLPSDTGRYLVSELEGFLKKHHVSLNTLDLLVLDAGPGSYTGLRIGFAVARTLSQLNQIPLQTIDATQVIVAGYSGTASKVAVVLDARQNEFYSCTYQREGERWQVLSPLKVVETVETDFPCLGDAGPNLLNGEGFPPRADRLLWLGYEAWQAQGKKASFLLEPLYLRPTTAERKRGLGLGKAPEHS